MQQAEETRLWSELRRHEFLGTICFSVTSQCEAECERRGRLAETILKGPEPVTKRVRMLQDVCQIWNEFDRYALAGQSEIRSPALAASGPPAVDGPSQPKNAGAV